MNILYILYGSLSNAAYYRAFGMANELTKMNNQVTILCDDRKENILYINDYKNVKNLNFCYFKFSNNYIYHLYLIVKLRLSLNKIKPDYIIQLNPELRSLIIFSKTKYKVVAEWDEPAIFRNVNTLKLLYFKVLYHWLINIAYINISATKEFLKYLPDAYYIPHGQYLKNHTNLNVKKSEYSYFVYLGNFYSSWDHDILFNDLLKAKKRKYEPIVYFIGSGPEINKWKEFVELHNLKKIIFTGYLQHVDFWPILEGATALLFPMRDTKLNRCRCSSKIYAYIKTNRPIIAHSVGEIKELVKTNIYLAEPGSDLIELLEKNALKYITNIQYKYDNLEYKYLAKKFDNILLEYQVSK